MYKTVVLYSISPSPVLGSSLDACCPFVFPSPVVVVCATPVGDLETAELAHGNGFGPSPQSAS